MTVRLPRLLVLTDRRQSSRPLVDVVRAAVDGGARAVVLRDKDLPAAARCELVESLGPILHDAGGLLLSAGAHVPGADGTHLPATAPPAEPGGGVVGRSCHDAHEVHAAEAEPVDYVTVSPAFASRSKPGYGPVLGESGLAALASRAPVPVFALGGIETVETVRACRRAGAYGVAVMGAVMRAAAPDRVVRELLASAGASEQAR